jgi:methylglutaconyl-CoA hydratase
MSYCTFTLDLQASGVLTLTLNRPDVRNAFNEVVIQELNQVFQKEVLEAEVRAVVLRGAGKAFCAGGDLNWMRKAIDDSFEANFRDTRALSGMFGRMNDCPKPLIGVVHGAAIGGGVGLVSVCDLVIAEASTQFSLSEVRLGIVPACIGPFVVSKIGPSHARAFFMSAERFDARRAYETGLVHYVVQGEAALDTELARVLENILQCGPNAMNVAKQLVLDLSWPERRAAKGDTLDYVATLLAELRVSPEGQEGVKAFLEKRKPSWIKGAKA